MSPRLPEPCLCGADDCRRCHPEWQPPRCSRHPRIYLTPDGDCPKCEGEIDAWNDPYGWMED